MQQPDPPPLVAAQVDHDTPPRLGHGPQRGLQLWPAVAAQRAEHVPGEALRVQPHQDTGAGADLAPHQGHVLDRVHRAAVADRQELPVPGRQPGLRDPLHERLGTSAVGDQVRDRHQRQAVLVGEPAQLGQPGHRPVVVDHLGDDARGGQPGQPGQVHRRLGVPGPAQDAAVDGAQREDVPRPGELVGLGGRVDQHPDRAGPVGGRDAGVDAVAGVDRDGVGRALAVLVHRGHRRQLQPVQVATLHRHADHAGGVADREGQQCGGGLRRGEDDVPLVLAVLVVHDDHGLAGRDVGDRPLDRVQPDRRAHAGTSSGRRAASPSRPPRCAQSSAR